jgi:carbonic anhydrase
MQKLVDGVHHFQRGVFGSQREFFEKMVSGQRPMALFITCSDSRINPTAGGEAATIEFALGALEIPDVIVCGHSHCGAMKALIGDSSKLEDMPAMRGWLTNAEATRRIVKDKYRHLEGQALLTASVEENVLVQLENLRTHPVVAAGLARKTVNLHGWVYKLETGEVFAFNPDHGQFEPLTEHRIQTQAPPVRETRTISI